MDIRIEKLDAEEIERRGIRSWPVWEKEVSRFDWFYDRSEECLLLEGRVTVETENGSVSFGAGDFVTFPRGLRCVWDIKEAVRKHYAFR
jgi:uncharacterized cupin superfamily protein